MLLFVCLVRVERFEGTEMGYWGIRSLLGELMMPWTDRKRGNSMAGAPREYLDHSTRDRQHGGVSEEIQSPHSRGGNLLLSLWRIVEVSQQKPIARFSDSLAGGSAVGGGQDVVPNSCKLTPRGREPGTSKSTHNVSGDAWRYL